MMIFWLLCPGFAVLCHQISLNCWADWVTLVRVPNPLATRGSWGTWLGSCSPPTRIFKWCWWWSTASVHSLTPVSESESLLCHLRSLLKMNFHPLPCSSLRSWGFWCWCWPRWMWCWVVWLSFIQFPSLRVYCVTRDLGQGKFTSPHLAVVFTEIIKRDHRAE